jgi:hypothetical protein
MKLPPFTLVHNPRAGRQADSRKLALQWGELPEVLRAPARSIKPTFWRALVNSTQEAAARVDEGADLVGVGIGAKVAAVRAAKPLEMETLGKVIHEFGRHSRVETVGLWDLSSQVGGLPEVIQRLNESQPVLAFFEVQAAIRSGLISRPERVLKWAKELAGEELGATDLEQIESNVIYEDFSRRAERVRRDLGLDFLVGFTPSMIAFEEESNIEWNYFSAGTGRLALVSLYDLDKYARKARRPFEVAVGAVAIAQLLTVINKDLEFHDEIRGCLFDFNEDRDSIVRSIRALCIEDQCLKKIRPRYRSAAEAMVAALRRDPKAEKVEEAMSEPLRYLKATDE